MAELIFNKNVNQISPIYSQNFTENIHGESILFFGIEKNQQKKLALHNPAAILVQNIKKWGHDMVYFRLFRIQHGQ